MRKVISSLLGTSLLLTSNQVLSHSSGGLTSQPIAHFLLEHQGITMVVIPLIIIGVVQYFKR